MSQAVQAPSSSAPGTPRERAAGAARRLARGKVRLLGYAGIVVLLGVAALAPWIAPHDPHQQDISNVLQAPVWAGGEASHLLGTDSLGRDVLSRLIYGARSSVFISVCAMLLGATLGVAAGVTSGFLGRAVDTVLMRLGDVQLALPFILIAIVVLGMMTDRDAIHLIVVLGIPAWIVYARVVRSKVLAERGKDYVLAARTLGASRWRQMTRYVWPQVRSVVPPVALVDLSNLVIMESTLSFLGFGLTPPSISWGQMLAEGRQNMVVSPWLPILPGLAIMLTVLALNLSVERPGEGAPRRGRWRRRRTGPAATPSGTGSVRESSVQSGTASSPVLAVRGLVVDFPGPERTVRAVRGVSFDVSRGRILGIVGESGSGKSVSAFAVMGLLSAPGQISSGHIEFNGVDLTRLREPEMRALRGRRIGMIFQNPVGSLNPVLTIGYQLTEAIGLHKSVDRRTARRMAADALHEVGFGDPAHTLKQYPFRLSGGQNQRVMIALTMVTEPELLLADEPTTALDVTSQAQVLDQLRRVRDDHGTSIVLISHDMGIIGEVADDVVVMYAGQVCERGPARAVLTEPSHPYTRALLAAIPRPGATDLTSIPGDLPDPTVRSAGCPFSDRCPEVMEQCRQQAPALIETSPGRAAACHLYTDVKAGVPL